MASGVVLAAISEVLEQEEIKANEAMLGTIKTILENISEESRIDVFDLFAESLLALLNGCCSQGKAGQQDKASFWTRFQQIRTRELVSVWRKLGQNLYLEIHPVIIQTISTNIFTSIIENDKVPGNQSNLTTNKQIELTAEERNIIQYASGYIAMKSDFTNTQ